MKKSFCSRLSPHFILIAVGCLLFQIGCATIFQGRMQTIEVTSDPPGAKVFIDDKQISTTPVDIKVRRKDFHVIRLEKEGYAPYEIRMKRKMKRWILGEFLYPIVASQGSPSGKEGLIALILLESAIFGIEFCKAPGCLDTLVGVFRRPSGWPLSDCL